jgi:Zn-dependent protease with chaperone function
LPKPLFQLWGAQLITAVITLWAINAAIHLSLRSVNRLLWGLPWPLQLGGIPSFERDYSVWVIAGLIGLALASPWLMDQILSWGYGQRSLSTRQLQAQHPNALRLLRQVCRQHGWQLPELRLIPDSVPLCFSYGWLPRNTRIVVSQGLLDTCSEENLIALYSYELGHIANGDLPVISAIGMWLLLLYTGYWRLALWGNSLDTKPARITVGLVANGLYGVFWLLRKLVLWLSRLRCAWGDRRAVTLTQPPAQLQHSLLALTASLANHCHQQSLPPLLVCLDILMPLSTQAAISPGSFFPAVDALTLMAKDCLNPYRRWLLTNASHLPLAERLQQLDRQAFNQGRLGYLPNFTEEEPESSFELSPLLLQKAPVVGLLAGGGLALGLWFVGGIVNRFNWQRLSWFYQDSSLLQGGLLLGLGLGLLVRINTLYPDINPRLAPATKPGDALLNGRKILPVQGQPIRLEGKLIGPPGIANWFGQALYLETSEGIVRLKAPSPLLGWQGVIQSPRHVVQWLGRQVNVLGWQRQGGGLVWLDIAEICSSSQRDCFVDQGPLWATLVSLGLCLAGIWVILTGG